MYDEEKFTYKQAGVDIKKADYFIERIKPLINNTKTPQVIGDLGGFAGFFNIESFNIKDPVLVASTDGVGTKLLVAKTKGIFNTIGVDLVAMCVNDIITTGAKPLFFLDYISTGKLITDQAENLVKGISQGCQQAECALLGGETAEMPDVYKEGDFDLVGFCVGIVDKDKIINVNKVLPGDVIIGIQSSGVHSNGFSLIRKIFQEDELKHELGDEILAPTFIYVNPILKLIEKINVKSIAHITGGGLMGNIPRVLPENVQAIIDKNSWTVPSIFEKIQRRGNISSNEMFRTFNMGIGMVIVVSGDDVSKAQGILKSYYDLRSYVIGSVDRGKKEAVIK